MADLWLAIVNIHTVLPLMHPTLNRFVEKSICKAFNFLKYLNLFLKITIVIVTESYP